jgi:hypothetical protein
MPPICEAPYYAQIQSCTVSDFHQGCSEQCESALQALAASIISACSRAPALPNTLLGAILQGSIVEAICPPPKSVPPPVMTSHSVEVSMTTPTSEATPQAQPTTPSMAPPQPPPAPTTSSETSEVPTPTATLEGVTRVSMCGGASTQPSLPAPNVTSPANGSSPQAPQPTGNASNPATTPAAAITTSAAGGNAGEGGSGNPGAPFQLVGGNAAEQGSASTLGGSSVLALAVAGLACILL